MSDAAIAALITGLLGGGAVVQLIQRLLPSVKEKRELQASVTDAQNQFTAQVVKRVDALDAQVGSLRREADKWREQYFAERDNNSQLSAQVKELRSEVAEGKERVVELEGEVARLEQQVSELTRRSA